MIVIFGSINLDLIFPVSRLPAPGETLLAPAARLEPGGKGANQAVAAAKDGAAVIFAGAAGRDDLAETALRRLKQEAVDITRLIRADVATGCAAITVDESGRNHVVVASGANLMASASQVENELLTPDAIVVLQMEVRPTETAALIERGRKFGARMLLNLAPAATLPKATLQALDILVVNENEAAWLAQTLACPSTAAGLADALGVNVVRSLGEQGLEADGAMGRVRLPAHPVAVVDTTAAGDCLVGVLAAALDRGLPWADALARANRAAGLACTRAGTQGSLPSGAEIDFAGL